MMGTIRKLTLGGALLGAGAALFLLGTAAGVGFTLEGVVPGLLSLAFSAIGVWGGYLAEIQPSKAIRAILGTAIGGLVAADLFFLPAALIFVGAAIMIWRIPK